jgi:protein-tyrosine phosphatase
LPDIGFDLLFVCTGNICRSPMAELIAVDELTKSLGAEAPRIRVHSSGTHGLVHHPLDATAAEAITALGVGDYGFRARRLVAEMVTDADLVLTATRQHRSAAVSLAPRAAARTFTIREFARLCSQVDPATITDADPVERFRALVPAAAAHRGHVHVPAYEDDIDDPYGGKRSEFDVCAADIAASLRVPLSIVCAPPRSS